MHRSRVATRLPRACAPACSLRVATHLHIPCRATPSHPSHLLFPTPALAHPMPPCFCLLLCTPLSPAHPTPLPRYPHTTTPAFTTLQHLPHICRTLPHTHALHCTHPHHTTNLTRRQARTRAMLPISTQPVRLAVQCAPHYTPSYRRTSCEGVQAPSLGCARAAQNNATPNATPYRIALRRHRRYLHVSGTHATGSTVDTALHASSSGATWQSVGVLRTPQPHTFGYTPPQALPATWRFRGSCRTFTQPAAPALLPVILYHHFHRYHLPPAFPPTYPPTSPLILHRLSLFTVLCLHEPPPSPDTPHTLRILTHLPVRTLLRGQPK